MPDRVVSYEFRGKFDSLTSGLAATGRGIQDLGVKLTALDKNGAQLRRGLDTLGQQAGRAGITAAVGLGAVAKAAIDWETAWTGVVKTVDGTPEQLAKVETGLRELARTLPSSHQEIAAVAEAAGQLGVHTEDIVSFTKTMIDLGQTTNLSAEDAATAIAQMANVMGTAPDEIDNLGSALVALGNNGASTERQIIEMAQSIAGAGAQVGLTEANVLALANTAASMGIEVEAGGTAISTIFTKMAMASKQGGASLDIFAKTSGKTSEQFIEDFGRAPADTFAAFVGGLDQVNKSGGDVFTTLKNLGLSDVRVSRALLGMAASGNLLTDSLQQGNDAWRQNTALAAEAEKRYGTTSSQVKIAWNNMQDSAIDFGETALPVIAKGAEAAAAFAKVIGSLPGPIKNVTTSMLAITAIAGGGLWFGSKVVGGIVATKGALKDLNITLRTTDGNLTRTGRSLRGLAIGSGVLVGLAALDGALSAIDHHDIGPTVNELTNMLNELSASKVDALPKDFRDLGESLDLVESKSSGAVGGVEKLLSPLTKLAESISGGLGFDDRSISTKIDDAASQIDTLDQALAGMVQNGSANEAARAFSALATAQGLSTDEQTRLMSHLPQYRDAIAGAAGGTGSLASGQRALGDSASDAADDIAKLVKQMRDARKASLSAFDAETQYREALKSAREQADKNNEGIKGASDAALANRDALSQLASAWNNQSDSVKNNENRYREARKAFIDTATAMGVPIAQARRLARRLLEIPESKVIDVQANTDPALVAVKRLVDQLRGLHINIPVTASTNANVAEAVANQADGGPIYGPGTATSDSIPAMLSNGEYVIRAAAVQKYGLGFFDAANQMRLAGGGSPTKPPLSAYIRNDLDLKFPRTLAQWERALKRSEKAIDREREKRDDLVSARNDLASSTRDAFRSDLFNLDRPDGWEWMSASQRAATATSPLDILRRDIANASTFQSVLSGLQKRGLDGQAFGALAGSGDLAQAQMFAGFSNAQLAEYERLYNQRQKVTAGVGAFAGNVVYGKEIAESNEHLKVMVKQGAALEKRVHAVEKAVRDHSARGKASKRSSAASVRTGKKNP